MRTGGNGGFRVRGNCQKGQQPRNSVSGRARSDQSPDKSIRDRRTTLALPVRIISEVSGSALIIVASEIGVRASLPLRGCKFRSAVVRSGTSSIVRRRFQIKSILLKADGPPVRTSRTLSLFIRIELFPLTLPRRTRAQLHQTLIFATSFSKILRKVKEYDR